MRSSRPSAGQRRRSFVIVMVHRGFPEGSLQDPYYLGWQGGLGKLAMLLDAAMPRQEARGSVDDSAGMRRRHRAGCQP
jgi:hypothetical protein